MKFKNYKEFINYKKELNKSATETAASIEEEFKFVKEQFSAAYIFKTFLNYIPTPGFLKGGIGYVVNLFTNMFEEKLKDMKGIGKVKYYLYLFSTLLIPVIIKRVVKKFT